MVNEATVEVLRVEIAKLELKPGDKVLVKVPKEVPTSSCLELVTEVKLFLEDIRFFLFSGDIEFSVLSPEAPLEKPEPGNGIGG